LPDVAFELATSFLTLFKIVHVPFDSFRVNAAQEVLDAHSAWQLETLLYFLEVFTVPIFPESEISAIGMKFISDAAEGKENMIAVKLKSFVNLFIIFPVFFFLM
jgi:hypothetical protein